MQQLDQWRRHLSVRTFVDVCLRVISLTLCICNIGTPCYLAPEVEFTSKGLGGTYGLPADCWSLGAVLYVTLVARFPEFEKDDNGKVVVKLAPVLWDNISSDAKELIRGLMNTNATARLTVSKALQHPWFKEYRASNQELVEISLSAYEMGQQLQEEENRLYEMEHNGQVASNQNQQTAEMTPMGYNVNDSTMVVRTVHAVAVVDTTTSTNDNMSSKVWEMQPALAPLLHLHR